MGPRIVDKKAKRKEILTAALRVFARSGLSSFKMIEIADEAGVGKGTLYEYFPSKTDLIAGCFADMVADWGGFVQRRIAALTDPVAQLKTVVSATFEYFGEERERVEVLFDFYAMGIPRRDGKPALIEMSSLYGEMIKQLGSIIQAGIDSGQLRLVNADLAASVILGAIDGLFFQIALRVVNFDDIELQEQVGDVLLGGLLPASGGNQS